ncbi:MAG: hypothetical protein NUV98_06100 [Candidatus Roizmanbacteria bacterium]|nr:hypothetical protein [Candidatus Roizmanbacteria bacterium]
MSESQNNSEQTSTTAPEPSKTPEQIAVEKEARRAELPARRIELKEKLIHAMFRPHPVAKMAGEILQSTLEPDSTIGHFTQLSTRRNLDEFYTKVDKYLKNRSETGSPDIKLDQSIMVGAWSILLAQEKADGENPKDDQIRQRRREVALTLFDAFAHHQIPELPNLRTANTKSAKEWSTSEFWKGHPESTGKLSSFIAEVQHELEGLRPLVFADPSDTSIQGETGLNSGRKVLVDGISPEKTVEAVLDNFNNVCTILGLKNDLAMRRMQPPAESKSNP